MKTTGVVRPGKIQYNWKAAKETAANKDVMNKRVVITGLGVFSGSGKGKDDFYANLAAGRPGYRPITLFDTSPFRVKTAGEVPDFDAKVYMGPKGLRTLDRSTRLLVSAGKLAVADSGLTITEENTDDVGVSVGTTLGSLKSISDFDEVTLREGPRYTNPALFPNTVINSPASQVSIWENIQGFNTTISTGFTASLDAMQYAYDFIQMERAKVVYTGGVEELCMQTFYGFHALKALSGSQEGQEFCNCPFDRRRNGVTFGEGACLMALEDYAHARQRNAPVIAEVASFGYCFDPFRIHKFNPRGIGMIGAMRDALDQADMAPADIDLIVANANSMVTADRIETMAIREVFGPQAVRVPVTAVKSMTGECYSVSGALNVAAALGVLEQDVVPPTIDYREPDPECALNIVTKAVKKAGVNTILVNNFSPSGSNACLILKRYKP